MRTGKFGNSKIAVRRKVPGGREESGWRKIAGLIDYGAMGLH